MGCAAHLGRGKRHTVLGIKKDRVNGLVGGLLVVDEVGSDGLEDEFVLDFEVQGLASWVVMITWPDFSLSIPEPDFV